MSYMAAVTHAVSWGRAAVPCSSSEALLSAWHCWLYAVSCLQGSCWYCANRMRFPASVLCWQQPPAPDSVKSRHDAGRLVVVIYRALLE